MSERRSVRLSAKAPRNYRDFLKAESVSDSDCTSVTGRTTRATSSSTKRSRQEQEATTDSSALTSLPSDDGQTAILKAQKSSRSRRPNDKPSAQESRKVAVSKRSAKSKRQKTDAGATDAPIRTKSTLKIETVSTSAVDSENPSPKKDKFLQPDNQESAPEFHYPSTTFGSGYWSQDNNGLPDTADPDEGDDTDLPYAPRRRKESLECLNFVDDVLTEHFRKQNSLDHCIPSSQFHERDESLLFVNQDHGTHDSIRETCQSRSLDGAQPSPIPEEVSLPNIDFEAFEWDPDPEEEAEKCSGEAREEIIVHVPKSEIPQGVDACETIGVPFFNDEGQTQAVYRSGLELPPDQAGRDTAQLISEIGDAKEDRARRQLDEQLAEYHRQEAAKADLLTVTEEVESSDDDDLAELLAKLKPRKEKRGESKVGQREVGRRHPVQSRARVTPVVVPKNQAIEALRKVEAKERARTRALEYSRLDDQENGVATVPGQNTEHVWEGSTPILGKEVKELQDLLGDGVVQQSDLHSSIWDQLIDENLSEGPIHDLRQVILRYISDPQLRGMSFGMWQEKVYQRMDEPPVDRPPTGSLVVSILGASYDLPLRGVGLVRRWTDAIFQLLDNSTKKDVLAGLVDLMNDQGTEHFDAHVFGLLDGQRPFISWLSLKLLHSGLLSSELDFSTEPPADLLLSLMETDQIALSRGLDLSQTGDDYASLRRQSRQLASHWHDLSILFGGYKNRSSGERLELENWQTRAEVVLSDLVRCFTTRGEETFNPKRAQIRETITLLQFRTQYQINDLLMNRLSQINESPIIIEDLLQPSLDYYPPEDLTNTTTTYRQKPRIKLRSVKQEAR